MLLNVASQRSISHRKKTSKKKLPFFRAQTKESLFLSLFPNRTNRPISRSLEIHPSFRQLGSGISVISCCTWPSPRKSKIRPCTRAEAEGSQPRRISRGPCRSGRSCIRRTWRRSRAPRAPLSVPCCTRDAPSARDRTTVSKGSCNNTGEKNVARLSSRMGVQLRLWKGIGKGGRCRELRERERGKFKRDNSVSVSCTTKGKDPPKVSEYACVKDRALFKLICLIKFVSIPFLLPREDEIIPKSHRSPAKAHQSSPRRGKRERWRMGNPRSWNPHFFFFFFLLCSWWTLRERYPHHFLDQGVPFRKQSLRGLAEGAKDTRSAVEIHPERMENWKN